MEQLKFKPVVSLLAALLLFACSEKNLPKEDMDLNLASAVTNQTTVQTRVASLAKASVSMVNDENDSNAPAMYEITYPEGERIIISVARDYFPVFAYSDEGFFELKPEAEMGDIVILLEKAKESMKASETFANIQAQVRSQWQTYAANDGSISSRPPAIMTVRIIPQ